MIAQDRGFARQAKEKEFDKSLSACKMGVLTILMTMILLRACRRATATAALSGLAVLGLLYGSIIQAQTAEVTSKKLEFDVAVVKLSSPDAHGTRFSQNGFENLKITNTTLKALIAAAYEIREIQISGGPGWIGSEGFDVEAKVERTGPALDFRNLTQEQRTELQKQFNERLQSLLADRFQLIARKESKEMAVYFLVQTKTGSKLKSSSGTEHSGISSHNGSMTGTHSPASQLAASLSRLTGRLVIDTTGLEGPFDWKMEWTPDSGSLKPSVPGSNPSSASIPDVSGPSLFTALQEQLGLKLESHRAPGLLLVIERAEKPSAN